jgi:hypothetical protein
MFPFSSRIPRLISGLLLLGSLSLSCQRPPVKKDLDDTNPLVGSWEKINPAKCSEIYPTVIEFSANGVYQTQSEVTTISMAWDAGTYAVDRQIVKIANALEVSKPYRFVIKNEIVTFEDDQGCRFPYRRM